MHKVSHKSKLKYKQVAKMLRETNYAQDLLNAPVDLLVDLMHYCHVEEIDFQDALRVAGDHFREEV